MAPNDEAAFPRLTMSEIAHLKPFATPHDYADGDTVFRAGQADIDLFVVETGSIEIQNPADEGRVIVTHDRLQFSGDIDLLTGRPVIVTGVARGQSRIWRVPGTQLRGLLNRVPSLGEKLIVAFTRRRELLSQVGKLGLHVVGAGRCRDTNTVREFLYKNFVPFTWFDPETEDGQRMFQSLGAPKRTPVIVLGDGKLLVNPSLIDLARAAGIWKYCPAQEVDLAIVGAGPAGLAAAVYASSEGLSTLMLDRLGPGGQAGGSSRIENFIGFPAGLSGADLAMRGVLQMLKFGAKIVAPVNVESLTPAKNRDDRHILKLDCGAEIKSRVVLLATGVRWRRLEVDGAERFRAPAFITPARRWKPTSSINVTSPSLELETRPDRRSCSSPSAARSARCTRSSATSSAAACRNTCRIAFARPATSSSTSRLRLTRFPATAAWSRFR